MPNIFHNQKGVALILSIMTVSLMLFLGLYFVANSLTEKLIAESQASGVETYYLAEAGINEMLWKIINDPYYQDAFMFIDDWASTTVRNDPFGPGTGSYTVTASNTSAAHCDIYSTGQVDIGNGNFAQRVIKTDIFRAVGTSSSPIGSGYADGNITITNSYVKFLNGSAHSNGVFDVNNNNVRMFVDGDVEAFGNYLEHLNASTTILGWVYAANWPIHIKGTGTIPAIAMPAVDFDSADPTSYLSRSYGPAGEHFTEAEFDDLLCSKMGGQLVLAKTITYVDGDVDLSGPIMLKYPTGGGVLVVKGDFISGDKDYKTCGGTKTYGRPSIEFRYGAGRPSGILASSKIRFLGYTGNIELEGVIYADAEMDILNLDPAYSFHVKGGAIAQKLDIDSCFGWPVIEHDNATISDTIGSAISSPTIIIEHWEEEY